jgi:hypothetical protein
MPSGPSVEKFVLNGTRALMAESWFAENPVLLFAWEISLPYVKELSP